MVIEVRRTTSTLYMHLLGVRDDSDVDRAKAHALAVEERVVRALASSTELAEFRRIRSAEAGGRRHDSRLWVCGRIRLGSGAGRGE
jgi:multicomponent Na+:H+ antiporter subunit E